MQRRSLPAAFRCRAILCGFSAAALVSFGQAVPSTSSNAADDDVIVMSPFEVNVSKDVGYTAGSSLAGGRTDMPLKNTPAAISVMTRGFIDDVGGTSLHDLAAWSVNSIPEYSINQSPFGEYAIHLRGLGASYPSRNYFLWYVDGDGYNTERFEMARGPNGVLFGDGNIGGIATTWTKRARTGKAFVNVLTRVDTYGGYRASIDVNQPVRDDFALRLNALYDHTMSWRARSDADRTGLHLAGTWQITRATAFRFEGETGTRKAKIYTTNYGDHASRWDRATIYDRPDDTGIPPAGLAGTGVQKIASNRWVYIPAVPEAGYTNWNTRYETYGTQLTLLPDGRPGIANFPALPSRDFNLQPPDSIVALDYYATTLTLEHRFTDKLYAQIAYNRTHNHRESRNSEVYYANYQIDVNKFLPNGLPNPKFGVPFSDNNRQKQFQANTVNDIRALATYADRRDWIDWRLSAIIGRRFSEFGMEQYRLIQTNGPDRNNILGSANTFYERMYWDEPGKYNLGPPPSNIEGKYFDYVMYYGNKQRKYMNYYQLASMLQFLDKRLTVQLGIRYDDFHQDMRATGVPGGTYGWPVWGGNKWDPGKTAVFIPGGVTVTEASSTSKNAGAVYFLTEWLGVYANYAETFSTPSAGESLWDGRPPGISRSKGMDLGIKLELLKGKISGSINYYNTKQTDRLDFRRGDNHPSDISAIWTALDKPDRIVVFRDTQSYTGKGWEAEITANPSKNWTIMFNWALPQTEAGDLRPGLRAYYNANIAEWEKAIADNPGDTAIQNTRTNIDNIKGTLDGARPGVVLNNTYKYTGNIYATYTFRDGALKNLALGAGANFRGKSKIGNTQASAFDYIYGDANTVASAHISYKRDLSEKVSARFQINVYNLFNNNSIIHTATADWNGGRYLGQFRYIDPRRITLTVTFDF